MKETYSIGETSKLFNISTDTLRYYDKHGLVKALVNKENNYRYYSFKEIDLIHMYLYGKSLEIPLCDIKTLIANESELEYIGFLRVQERLIDEKIEYFQNLKKHNEFTRSNIEEIVERKRLDDFNKIEIHEEHLFYISVKMKDVLNGEYLKGRNLYQKLLTMGNFAYKIFPNALDTLDYDYELMNICLHSKKDIPQLKKDGYPIKELFGKFVTTYFYGDYLAMIERVKSVIKICNSRNIKLSNEFFAVEKFTLNKKDSENLYYTLIYFPIELGS